MTGAAPIYTPLLPSTAQVFQFAERARQMDQQRQQLIIQQQMKQQAADFDKAFDYKEAPVMAEYQPMIHQEVQQKMNEWVNQRNNPMIRQIASVDKNNIDYKVNLIKSNEAAIKETLASIKDNPIYNKDIVTQGLIRTYKDGNGVLIDPVKLNPEAPYKVLDSPGVINPVAWAQKFAKGIDEFTGDMSGITTDPQGRQFQNTWKIRNQFAKMKPDQMTPELDPKTGRIQLNITPELLNKAQNSPGGQRLIQDKLDEHHANGEKDYAPSDALRDILTANGYAEGGYKKEPLKPEFLNKSEFNQNLFIGGTATKHQEAMTAAEYFHKLINDPVTEKNKLLGDLQSKDWSTTFEKEATIGGAKLPASKNGYLVINYDPANSKAASLIEAFMTGNGSSLPAEVVAKMNKEHKFAINLDNEDRALTELNYWRNQSRNEDLNPDNLRKAYEVVRKTRKPVEDVASKYKLN